MYFSEFSRSTILPGLEGAAERGEEDFNLSAGRYELVPLAYNRIFRSAILPGFWLEVEWLLADPLPNAYDTLQEILRG